jgi:hypothetical protein
MNFLSSKLICGFFVLAIFSARASQSGMSVRLTDALEWLYPDSEIKQFAAVEEVDVPYNGVAEVNVLFNGLVPGVPLKFSADVQSSEWFRLVDVPVAKNTGVNGFTEDPGKENRFVSRNAPFRVYDAMMPLADGSFTPTSTVAALRFRYRRLPRQALSFDVNFSFAQGDNHAVRKLRVKFYTVILPPVGRDSFKYTNWMDYYGATQCHGIRSYWTEEHWKVVRRYIELGVYGRQNMVQLPLFIKKGDAGERMLDEERYEKFVAMLDSLGVAYLEGPHFCRFMDGTWSSKTFRTVIGTNTTTSAEGAAELAWLASSFADMIKRKGWTDRWYQHIADEPAAHNAAEYRITAGIVRKYMPGVKLIDAIEVPSLDGALDVYCPKNHDYELNRLRYESLRSRASDEIWCYTCCYPGGRWMNRLLDVELLRSLYLPLGCHLYSLDGYLHWGFNRYTPKSTPFTPGFGGTLPPGDTHLVYPGDDTGPWPSVRLEAMRQGFEDLELLRMLEKRSPKSADKLLKSVVRGFGEYAADVRAYRRFRKELLDLLKFERSVR